MSREVHVPFCEKLAGKFRRLTHLLILAKTRKHYQKARKKLFRILRSLKLTLSPSKSSFGRIAKKSFHYLGYQFDGTRTLSNPQKPVGVSLHARTHHRARQRLEEQEHLGVTPRHRLTYLKRWSNWWHLKDLLPLSDIACSWRDTIYTQDPIPIGLFTDRNKKWPPQEPSAAV